MRNEQVTHRETARTIEDNAGSHATLAIYWNRFRGTTPRIVQSQRFLRHDLRDYRSIDGHGTPGTNEANVQSDGYGRANIRLCIQTARTTRTNHQRSGLA